MRAKSLVQCCCFLLIGRVGAISLCLALLGSGVCGSTETTTANRAGITDALDAAVFVEVARVYHGEEIWRC